MNYKELQNRKYLFQLLINLNSNLKGLLKEELLDVNNMDYIIHTLIDSKYWLYFGLEKEVEYSYLEGLSKEAYWFIVNRDQKGRANIYFSIDSYIKRKMELHTLQSVKEEQLLYFNKYKVKYNFTQKDIDVIYEIVSFVYKRNSKY
ncbi:MAG: hypothetical protein ACI317_03700 [Floccifex porci]|uniref:hypothetical protein n=1 Tax=Floccifex porci TaxID=2606629 RepID=UPI003F11EC8E